MKRTTLMLDETLVAEARRLTAEPSISALVRRALEELVRRLRSRQILDYRGSGVWEGDLSEMRRDAPAPKRRGRARTGKRGR